MSSESGFLGMRGTGDWTNDERPKSWREGALKLYPNGSAPLTAITSKMGSEKVQDPEFFWWEKKLAVQGGSLLGDGVYTDSDLSAAKTGTGAVGEILYLSVAEATANHFRPGLTAVVTNTSESQSYGFGKVIGVERNGNNSYIVLRLLKSTADGVLGSANYVDIVGSSNPEGSNIPEAISYDPGKRSNFTQIHRTPLDITRTQRLVRMRIGDVYAELKREALEQHMIQIEMATLFGEKSERIGDNGKPERTSQGVISYIKEFAPDNVVNYLDVGLPWKDGGEDMLDESLERLFRFGSTERLCLAGSGALLGIQKLIKNKAHYHITAMATSYGIKVVQWITPFGEIYIKRAPLFTLKAPYRHAMVLFDPRNTKYRYLTDTTFKKDDGQDKAGRFGYDGIKEEFLTECGFEFHHAETMMYLDNIGIDPIP